MYSYVTLHSQACPMAEFVDSMGHWDLEKLRAALSEVYVQRISALMTPSMCFGSDVVGWRDGTNLQFLIRSTFLICRRTSEDVLHVLRGCPKARGLWERLVSPEKLTEFMSLPVTDWFMRNIKSDDRPDLCAIHWDILFLVMCWKL
ncbi:hypothetical protein V6N12_014814 [Hibiscus sabdariffa]|uniref:Reverse transcriptase zinc-binding domain-containing protein n=1 Tax=Hibiscus sabdariffa TaxID=183260 RepID=A0ABR2DM49_9ROSI